MSLDSLIGAFEEAEEDDIQRRLSDSSGSSDDLIPSDEDYDSERDDSDFNPSELADAKKGLGTPRPSVTEINDILKHLTTATTTTTTTTGDTVTSDSSSSSGTSSPSTTTTVVTSTDTARESKKRKKGEKFARFYINEFMCYQRLGRGAFGHVVLAKNLLNEQKVAIKIIFKSLLRKKKVFKERGQPPGTMLENIFREIAILKKLSHPHTVKLWQVIDDSNVDRLYMVFDYLNGGELVKIPHRLKPHICTPLTDIKQIRSYILDITLGLDYLHQNGVIHADVKPENVMVTHDLFHISTDTTTTTSDTTTETTSSKTGVSAGGEPSSGTGRRESILLDDAKEGSSSTEDSSASDDWMRTRHEKYGRCVLVDFGVSFVLSDEQMYEKDGFVSIAKGTPAFIAPECDEEEFSAYAMDVWAFGLTVYMMSVGVCVFAADTVHETYERVQTLDPSYPDGLDERLVDMCRQMLNKDPRKRIKLNQMLSHPFVTDNGKLRKMTQPDWVLKQMGRSTVTTKTETTSDSASSATSTSTSGAGVLKRRRSSIRDVLTPDEIASAITVVKPHK